MNKELLKMSLNEVIDLHLNGGSTSGPAIVGNLLVCSTLAEMVKEAASASVHNNSSPLLPLIGYMSVLDQIGNCYNLKNKQTNFTNGIKRALDLFSNLSKDEIKILYSLRNGIVHNASLISIGDSNKGGTSCAFTVHDFPFKRTLGKKYSPIISLPLIAWDGDISNLEAGNYAKISLEGIDGLVREVVDKASTEYKMNNLESNKAFFNGKTEVEIKNHILTSYFLIAPIPKEPNNEDI